MDVIKKECGSKSEMYAAMVQHIRDIFRETSDLYAALSNTSALLALYLDNVNWTGFYIMKDQRGNPNHQDEKQNERQDDGRYERQDDSRYERQDDSHAENRNEDQKEVEVKNRRKRFLVLGPFQGKPAVAQIEVGSGVCGTAVESHSQQRVDDVRSCCNHIACDLATASEIVTPIFMDGDVDGDVWGVIDIDSPVPARFDAEDEEGMKALAEVLGEMVQGKRYE